MPCIKAFIYKSCHDQSFDTAKSGNVMVSPKNFPVDPTKNHYLSLVFTGYGPFLEPFKDDQRDKIGSNHYKILKNAKNMACVLDDEGSGFLSKGLNIFCKITGVSRKSIFDLDLSQIISYSTGKKCNFWPIRTFNSLKSCKRRTERY